MLKLINLRRDKAKAQNDLKKMLRSALPSQGRYNIGYPGGNTTLELFSNGAGEIWYCSISSPNEEIPRYWNAFGIFDPDRAGQIISVELNVPIDTNGRQVSGFFAQDTETKKIYLMHSGRIGGGTKGIGKSAFLAWSQKKLIPVIDENGYERLGFIIGSLDKKTFVSRVIHFVEQVASFKKLVKGGQLNTPEFRKIVRDFERFRPEFSGKKAGHSGGAIDYISYHGDIVNELHRKRSLTKLPTEVIFNTGLIDLAVRSAGRLVEVYEVKTATDRQALYTAIGQLIVHSAGAKYIRKFLVVPVSEDLPKDIQNTLTALAITVWKFALKADGSGARIKT